MHKIGKYLGYFLLWAVVGVVVLWADNLVDAHRKSQPIVALHIEIEGGAHHALIDTAMVQDWIEERGLMPLGRAMSDVDIAAIEQAVADQGTVASADVYMTYGGDMHLSVEQRTPIARLRTEGYDLYITDDGYLLPAENIRSVLVPVITGDYTPIFGPESRGALSDIVRDTIASLDRLVEELEDDKIPYYEELRDAGSALRSVTSQSVRKGFFMSDEEYDVLNEALAERKDVARSHYRNEKQRIESEIEALTMAQEELQRKKQSLYEAVADFEAMVDMLIYIGDNNFWRSEVVQVVATNGGDDALNLAIIPRSGRFTVDLGTGERLEEKLVTLRSFYDNGLDNVGWDSYRTISLRYEGQVVCH